MAGDATLAWWEREPVAALVIVVACLLATLPWSVDSDLGFVLEDTVWTIVVMRHLQDVVLFGADWRNPPVGWPISDSIAQSDWVAGEAAMALPWRLVGVDMLVTHQHIVLLGMITTAYVGHLLARALLGRGAHTWVAGALIGAGPTVLAHVSHVNLVHHEAALGGALLLAVGVERRSWRLAMGGGALVGLSAWFGFYMGLHAALLAACLMAVAAAGRRLTLPVLAGSVAGASATALPLVPVIQVYSAFAREHDISFQENFHVGESWDLANTMRPGEALLHMPLHPIWPNLPPPSPMAFDPANPGYLALVLALLGAVWVTRQWTWAWAVVTLVMVTSLTLALGPEVVWMQKSTGFPGPYQWLQVLPGMTSLRAPARFLEVAFPALALFSAAGAHALLRRLPRRVRPVLGGALLAIIVLEAPATHAVPLVEMAPDPVYEALIASSSGGPIFDEIVVANRAQCRHRRSHSLVALLDHGRPVIGGVYARPFAELAEVNRVATSWPSPRAIALFQRSHVTTVLDHPPLRQLPENMECLVIRDHQLCEIEADLSGGDKR